MKVQAFGRGLDATLRDFVAGQQIFQRYTLSKILGRGGMGVVWLARDNVLERDVALKFLPEIVIFDRAMLSDLKREANRSLELTHKNIVRIYDFVHDESAACISMEYVDGDTLSNIRVDRPNKVFECWELGEWIKQFCEALDYAHDHVRVVHRDLKPANLMVNQRGELKVTDFGIARSLSDSVSMLTAGRRTSGTLVYMSPQQLDGGRATSLDDIYSLGATIYELLTGKPPFYSGNIDRQIHERVAPPMSFRREELDIVGAEPIDPIWEEVVATCLQKDPALRPQSAMEIVGLLTTPAQKSAPRIGGWFPSRRSDQKAAAKTPTPSVKTPPPASWSRPKTKTVAPKRESRHTFQRAWLGLSAAIFAIGGGARNAGLAVLRAIAAIFAGIAHGVTSFGRLVANDLAALGNAIAAAFIAMVRGAVFIVVAPAKLLFRVASDGIPALWQGMRVAGVALGKSGAVAARGLVVGTRVLTRETLFGTAITIIPAVLVGGLIWFFAIRTPPPPKQIVEQKPTLQPSPPRIEPTVQPVEPMPPPLPQGGLSVATIPSGAKIVVDGSIVQTTPASVSNLSAGRHHLQIVMPDYITEERDVDIKDGEVVSQGLITLRRIPPPAASIATVTADGVSQPTVNGPEQEQKPAVKRVMRSKPPAVTQKPAPTPARQVAAAAQPAAPPKAISKTVATPKPSPEKKRMQNPFGEGVPGG